jgi:spore maturation protein CgeB
MHAASRPSAATVCGTAPAKAAGRSVGDHLEANLRALAARDPQRAAAIRAAPPCAGQVAPTTAGSPTLVCNGLPLHNRYDPVREAEAWALRHGDRLADAATAIVVGFGLGYHVEALASRFTGRVVVVEPDASLLRTALATRPLGELLARVDLAGADLAAPAGRAAVLPYAPAVVRAGDALRAVADRLAARAGLAATRLRVLVVSPLGGGSHPLTHYCARALAGLGHAVTVLDLAPFAGGLEAIGRFGARGAARREVETAYLRFLGDGILAAVDATAPDLLLAMAQAPLLPPVLDEIGRRGVLRAFWFVEDHRLFPYWRDVLPAYDHFFAIQQGAFLAETAGAGGGAVHYLPCAADPGVHAPLLLDAAERAELGAPVAFVGAGYRNRRLAFRPLLDLGLRIWGSEWAGAGAVEEAVQRAGARIPTEDTVRIFNATTVNLNLHSSTWVDGVEPHGDFVNPRTFELAACGAFQLVDRRALLPALFAPDDEVAVFDDAGALRERVRHWLAHPEERRRIAAAGRARALREHTYRHRMAALLEAVWTRDGARLGGRVRRDETLADAAAAAGDTPLGRWLGTLPAGAPFSLEQVAREIGGRQGGLAEPEAIFLFLHQFDDLYLREQRA